MGSLNWKGSRRLALDLLDLVATVTAIILALAMRFDGAIPSEYLAVYLRCLPLILPFRILIYHAFGLYRQEWAYASLPELLRIVWAVSAETLASAFIIYGLAGGRFPRSVLIMEWFIKIGGIGLVRLSLRLRRDYYRRRRADRDRVVGEPTLIYGAGDAGAMLVRELLRHPEAGCAVVGFIDDDLKKKGLSLAGKPVLGTRNDIMLVIKQYSVTHLIIALPSAGRGVIREIVEMGRELGLQLKTLPGLYEIVNGNVSISQIRDVQIEDLLGRDEIKVDIKAVAGYLSGETVLVTGAGGSIGSEICRQAARFNPKRLLLLGHGENSIYEIDIELRTAYPALSVTPVIADIQDMERMAQVFERFQPGVVFHAAAHKHVPLMEENPEEAIKNNVFGTLNVAWAAKEYGAKRFVLISSDKAVNPKSVMGATKRAAEQVVHSLSNNSSTVFVAVRFGNVLGSRGSVVPLFKKQIAAGGPVTVTDPRMVRYFMTIPEAVQLVIQAGSMGSGGEIFLLDMGKPVKIIDLARDLIRLSGFEPDTDIPIVYTGVRGGEKLFEELLTAEEGTLMTKHERIFMVRMEKNEEPHIQEMLNVLQEAAASGRCSKYTILRAVYDSIGSTNLGAV